MAPDQIRSVFHPSDFSRADQSAFTHALRIALAAKAELGILQVEDPKADAPWAEFPSIRQTLATWAILPSEATPEDLASTGLVVRKIERRGSDASAEIQTYVADNNPSLVVLATPQHANPARWLNRAVSEPITRTAHALTLFVPRRVVGFVNNTTGETALRNILIPMDKAPHPQAAIDAAAMLARTLGCQNTHFIMLFVGPEQEMPRIQVPWESGWSFEARSRPGSVVETILTTAEADDVDLIVMAKRGHRNFLDALRGSTTERVVRGTKCPVLAVPAT
jgi:nucleotide-binding universal stress UspA family protein